MGAEVGIGCRSQITLPSVRPINEGWLLPCVLTRVGWRERLRQRVCWHESNGVMFSVRLGINQTGWDGLTAGEMADQDDRSHSSIVIYSRPVQEDCIFRGHPPHLYRLDSDSGREESPS